MLISELLNKGGPLMPLILLVAALGAVLLAERLLVWAWWHIRERPYYRAYDPERLLALVAEQAAENHRRATPLVWLLAQAAAVRNQPEPQRENDLQAKVLAAMPQVEARIATIGWLGGILPVLGLLGTVSGMITTFDDLAVTTSRQVLSKGLSEALWTTEAGLLGALPLLAGNHLLTRLKARWLNHLERMVALLYGSEASSAGTVKKPEAPAGSGHEA